MDPLNANTTDETESATQASKEIESAPPASAEPGIEDPGPAKTAAGDSPNEEARSSEAEEISAEASQAIFEAGQEAGRGGLDAAHCPYSEGDMHRAIWLRGHKVGAESRPPDKAMAAAAGLAQELIKVPDRFFGLFPGRIVYYAERVNGELQSLPAMVVRVPNQPEGLTNLQVFRNDHGSLMFTKNVPYEPSGEVRKTWSWPQGED